MRTFANTFRVSAWLALIVAAGTAAGQGPRGDRGGLLSILRRDDVRQELGISAEQAAGLDALRSKASPDKAFYDGFMERLTAAETEDQRKPIRDEMAAAEAKARQDAELEARKLLSPEQFRKLTDRLIRDRGVSALANPVVREQLELTPEQSTKLDEIQKQREEATKELFTGTDPNRFETFQKEWDAKPLAVLTESQRTRWGTAVAARVQPFEQANATDPGTSPDRTRSVEVATDAPAPRRSSTPVADPPAGEAAAPTGPVATFGGEPNDSNRDERDGEPLLSFNFRYAPWSEVLKLFADFANLTLDLDDVPPGTFNYYDDRKYTPTEALDVLNGYLLQKGYVLVRRDSFLVCLNIDEGIPPNLVPNVTADELPRRGQNELLNVVFPIEGANPADVAKEVELLLGPQGKVVPLGTSKSLVVTDIGSNLRRIDRLLSAVSAAGLGDLAFKSYPLKHIDPRDAESIVKNQLGLSTGVTNVSSSSAFDQFRRDRGDRDRGDERRAPTPAVPATQTRVAADERTSSLLVTATPAQHKIAEDVLKVTDVPADSDGRDRRSSEPYLKVYSLRNSDPQEVVKTLDVLMPGIVVNEDGRNDKIHILAPQAFLRRSNNSSANSTARGATAGRPSP